MIKARQKPSKHSGLQMPAVTRSTLQMATLVLLLAFCSTSQASGGMQSMSSAMQIASEYGPKEAQLKQQYQKQKDEVRKKYYKEKREFSREQSKKNSAIIQEMVKSGKSQEEIMQASFELGKAEDEMEFELGQKEQLETHELDIKMREAVNALLTERDQKIIKMAHENGTLKDTTQGIGEMIYKEFVVGEKLRLLDIKYAKEEFELNRKKGIEIREAKKNHPLYSGNPMAMMKSGMDMQKLLSQPDPVNEVKNKYHKLKKELYEQHKQEKERIMNPQS